MGGFGLGRPTGSGRHKVEACRSIDANRLHRAGCLRAGWMGSLQWTRDGEKIASIKPRAEHDRLHLTYRVRRSRHHGPVRPCTLSRRACRAPFAPAGMERSNDD